MAITTIEFVDTDLSTVLFDLHSATGSTNSSWGSVITKFGLGGNLTTTAPHDPERFEHPGADGGFTTFSRRGLGEAKWRQVIAGSTEANLRLGVGRLTDLITRGTILRIVTSTTTRYLRIEPSAYPSPFQGKELELHDIFQQFSFRQGLDIAAACQPYWEGAAVSVGAVTVPNDPATSTKARVYPVTGVTGDLPTPARVKIQPTTGDFFDALSAGWRARNTRASTYFSTYLSDTAFAQCEASGRGWTIALGAATAGAVVADASPGSGTSVARYTAVGTTYAARVEAIRTTNLESLRGSWDVRLRCAASAAAVWEVGLVWDLSTTPSRYVNDVVTHDVSGASSFPSFVELDLGRIHIPENTDAVLGGLGLEVYVARASGTGNLDMDFLWLTPANDQGVIVAQENFTVRTSEAASTAPASNEAHHLDTSGNYKATLKLEGALPVTLQPGDNHLMIYLSRTAVANYDYRTTVNADIATVSVIYSPRFAL